MLHLTLSEEYVILKITYASISVNSNLNGPIYEVVLK